MSQDQIHNENLMLNSENTSLDTESLTPEKAYKLGELYLNGDGVEKNEQTAFDYFKIAADQGHVNAQYKLGFIYDNGLGLDQDYVTAIAWYKKAASQNHITANYRLGRMHFLGEGVEQDNDLVFEYFKVAAELGDAESQYELGLCYKMGYGVDESYDQVIPWHLKAADQGHQYAKYNLGIAFFYGVGVDVNYKLAYKYMLEADDRNHESYYYSGKRYFYGEDGEDINYEIAFECYKIAANHDINDSPFHLAFMYQFGLGTEKDEGLAIEWYTKAAPNDELAGIYLAELYHGASKEFQDFSKANEWYQDGLSGSNTSYVLRDIGLFYEHGDVFEQDYGKALDYYLQSADHKNIGAYLNIAQLYYFGLGVEQDLRTCFEWLSKIESEKPSDMCTHVYIQYGREAFSRPSNFSKDRIYSVISEDALFGKAHHLLGLLYTQGEGGIDKDHKKAVKHFKIAFEKGVEEAQVYIHEANRIDIQSLSLAETVTKNDEPIK